MKGNPVIIHAESSFPVYLLKVSVASVVASTVFTLSKRVQREFDNQLPSILDRVIGGKKKVPDQFIGFTKISM